MENVIYEGNILIATKLLKWDFDEKHQLLYSNNTDLVDGYCNITELKFNSDWNWIMYALTTVGLQEKLYNLSEIIQFLENTYNQKICHNVTELFLAVIMYLNSK